MNDKEIAAILEKENSEYKKVDDEHRSLDIMLAEMDKKLHLTPEEEVERKKLQKIKLAMKDKMAEFIRQYKKEHSI